MTAGLADRYRLEDVIGRGGMATVYRAVDLKHGRSVAVKVLRSDLAAAIGTQRFLKEIEIAARLNHPHILPLLDSGEAGGILYYVMPLVEGESLRGLLNRLRLMDLAGALEITRRVADALDYAHGRGVLHRDIKPENILLPSGQAVVADFGIAKAVSSAGGAELTRTGIVLGTPGYMSPEQAAGLLDLDQRTDVYSLAVVVYEMLVGGLPGAWLQEDAQRAGRFLEATAAHRAQLDRFAPGLEGAMVRALAVRSEARYPSPGEFAAALEHPEEPAAEHSAARPLGQVAVSDALVPVPEGQVPAALQGSSGFLGGPTLLVCERQVDGEVSDSDHQALIGEMQATFGVAGHASSSGRSLIWTARRPKKPTHLMDWETWAVSEGDAPDVMVRVISKAGKTRIRVEQRIGETAGGVFAGVMGGGGAVGLALILISVFALGRAEDTTTAGVVLMGLAALLGSFPLARGIYRSVVSSKRAMLESLADRIAEQSEEAPDQG